MHLRASDWMRYSWHCCPFHGSMMKFISQWEILLELLSKNGTQLFRVKSVCSNRAVAEKKVT